MKPHVATYLKAMRLTEADTIMCELCAKGWGPEPRGHSRAVDIHHIYPKGMGGSKLRDHFGNLIALCRPCHTACHGPEPKKWRDRCIDAIGWRDVMLKGNAKARV